MSVGSREGEGVFSQKYVPLCRLAVVSGAFFSHIICSIMSVGSRDGEEAFFHKICSIVSVGSREVFFLTIYVPLCRLAVVGGFFSQYMFHCVGWQSWGGAFFLTIYVPLCRLAVMGGGTFFLNEFSINQGAPYLLQFILCLPSFVINADWIKITM